jgi:hypothetical protein
MSASFDTILTGIVRCESQYKALVEPSKFRSRGVHIFGPTTRYIEQTG